VAERVLVGNEFYVSISAIGIERLDIVRGKGRSVVPDDFVISVGEGVLGVELQLIEFESGEQVYEFEKGFLCRDFAAGDIEHVAADRKVWPVFDFETRESFLVLGDNLFEGLFRVESCGLVAC